MISRAIAAFFGCFTLLNLLGDWIAPGFNANIWWIDLSPLPRALGGIALLVAAIAFFLHATQMWQKPRIAVAVVVSALAAFALIDTTRFYALLHRHRIETSVPIPFSAIVFIALIFVAWRSFRPGRAALPRHRRARFVGVFVTCLIAFPLAQMHFFGHTDYRRRADAIVVFGARAHADGTPSGVLADRVRTACELYRNGLAPTLVFSGGPGDGAIDEAHAMRRMALSLGVPDSAIRLDSAGVNTDATVHNTIAMFHDAGIHRVLAVSHSYHLPRIKLAYQQAGWQVYTVPAKEYSRLPGGGHFLIARECAALWAYYFHPLM